jgi:hypothetical protein
MFDETEFREDEQGIIKVEPYIKGLSQEYDFDMSPIKDEKDFSFKP